MFIRYQTARNVGGATVAIGLVAGTVAIVANAPPSDPADPGASAAVEASDPTRVGTAPALDGYVVVIRRAEQRVEPGSTHNDVLGDAHWRVDLIESTGDDRIDRVELDPERDGGEPLVILWDGLIWAHGNGFWAGEDLGWRPAPVALTSISTAPSPAGYAVIEQEFLARPVRAGQTVTDPLGPGRWRLELTDTDGDTSVDLVNFDFKRNGFWAETWTRGVTGEWEVGSAAEVAAAASAAATAEAEIEAAETREEIELELEEAATPNAKIKDLFEGERWKVNLYEDDGDTRWDRAKIDFERDEVWDEKWSRKDDGTWSIERIMAEPETTAAAAGAEHAAIVKEMLERPATSAKIKDLTSGRGAKVNLYDDDGDGRWDRAKLDNERDETWDEKWTRKPDGTLERKIEATGQVLVWSAGAWAARE